MLIQQFAINRGMGDKGMSDQKKVAFSVLDLASRKDTDQGPAPALQRSLALAQHVERLGFTRFSVLAGSCCPITRL